MRREEGEWMKQSLSRSSNPQLFYKNAVISLNSQENTSAGAFFLINLYTIDIQLY